MRLLVVEDEEKLAGLLARGLKRTGYAVDLVPNGEHAVWMASEQSYDAVVLDVMLPDIDGFQVCREIRAAGSWVPILMLTGRDRVVDRVTGLDAGADDYLVKPFDFDELQARIRALIRRPPSERPPVVKVGDTTLDPASHLVTRDGVPISLTNTEFSLLELFMRHPGEALSRSQILSHVWDFAFESDSNVVDVYVGYLRNKLDRPFGKSSIQTVRGVGYRFVETA